jgi:hypothetical protein
VQGEPQRCLPHHTTNSILKRKPIQSSIPGVIEIPLSTNHKALIDECDSDLAQLNWTGYGKDGRIYVHRNARHSESPTKKIFQMHRVIMERILGRTLERFEEVDHEDLNPLNNRRGNLRLASKSQNMQNRGATILSTSGYKGVFWQKHAKKWRAMIGHNGKKHHLGYFDTPEQAYKAYCEAASKYHGEFARFE